jgi:amino acid adenylation domain-containing protein
MDDSMNGQQSELSAAKQALLRVRIEQARRGKGTIPRRAKAEAPLSFAQQRLWFLDQFYPRSCAYNVPRVFRLHGQLALVALQRALNAIVERHEILRTTYRVIQQEPTQLAAANRVVRIEQTDLTSLATREREAAARDLIRTEVERPFDLSTDLMLRATLLRLDEDEHILVLMTHHIASDGWSKGVMFRELAAFYNEALTGDSAALPELLVQYGDFAAWQRTWTKSALLAGQVACWKQRLEGAPALLELPTDYPRPPVQGFAGATECSLITPHLLDQLRAISQREGTTLFMTLLASFYALLSRYTGQQDIVIGTPIAGRTRCEVEPLIGDFVNILPIRIDLAGDPSFLELLRRVKEVALEAYDNQDVPFESLVEELERFRDMSRDPIFQAMFILEAAPPPFPTMQGLKIEIVDFDTPTAKNDLILIVAESPAGAKVKLEYRTELFANPTIVRLLEHYRTLLERIAADPDCSITRFAILPPQERRQVIETWNDTASAEPVGFCLHQLFESQRARTPDAIAVELRGRQLTYRQLDERANQLAHHLRKRGVRPDSRVGICVHRSPEMIIGLMGILKAGGAYVPLDPAYPPDRLEFMLHDGGAEVLVTEENLRPALSDYQAQVVMIDRDWASISEERTEKPRVEVTPAHLSYVIFTSGSTGRPKGVQLEHGNVVNFINSARRRFGLGLDDTYLGVASMSFDASVLDFFLPLSVGARLLMVDGETTRDGSALAKTIADAGVTAMHATPSTWSSLLEAGWSGDTRLKAFSGGEALSWDLAGELLARCSSLWNLYGPTETAVYSVIHNVARSDGTVLVGRPINNTQIYILDAHLEPVPIGVPGEIYIGGRGVARGYLNRPELSAEKFVADPFRDQPNARMYRTGDRGRYRADGAIQCLGRVDHQVKLRGFRIELGEVEAVLREHSRVRQAVAEVRSTSAGDKRLVAYLVLNDSNPEISDLRSFLRTKLPDYMVPNSFVVLERLPLSPNGKLNRRALPDPDDAGSGTARAFASPSTPVEQAVAEIFAEVLELGRVGLHDDFFELGGHSLLATRVVSRLRDRFHMEMTPRVLFESPTVHEMSSRISGLLVATTDPHEVENLLAELAGWEES